MTWLAFALLAAVADGTKDFVSKRTLAASSPYVVSWALFTVAAPLLLVAAATTEPPELGPRFIPAVVATCVVYVGAVILYMSALKASDLSLSLPMISFTPALLLLTGPLVLGELPPAAGIGGVGVIVLGAYLLNLKDARIGILEPFRSLAKERGPRLMLVVALLFSVTATTAKVTVQQSSPLWAFATMYSFSAAIFNVYVWGRRKITVSELKQSWRAILLIGALVAVAELGVAYGLSLALAVYVVSVKRLSILVGVVLGVAFLKERQGATRLLGAAVMIAGILLITLIPR